MAIAKVILNGDTLMDVTSNTVVANKLVKGITATKNDGTSISGTYRPILEDIEITAQEESIIVDTTTNNDIIVKWTQNMSVVNRTNIGNSSTSSALLKSIDLSKKYNIVGYIKVIDSNNNILETIKINEPLDVTINDYQNLIIDSNNYISSVQVRYFYQNSGASPTLVTSYERGNFGWKTDIKIIESNEGYEGLSSVIINPPEMYGLYKCMFEKRFPIMASGSSSYNYTASMISDWCNSFSNTSNTGGNVYYRQFAGINFSGSFYFNNIQRVASYTFARAWDGNGMSDTGTADFYFPAATIITEHAFYYNGNIRAVYAPVCTILSERAFQGCKLSSISFPVCEIISGSVFKNCNISNVTFPNCTVVGQSAFESCGVQTVDFPVCTTISSYAFSQCSKLSSINFPECTLINTTAFYRCASLTSISFPACQTVSTTAFFQCSQLTTANLPNCTVVSSGAFSQCYNLSNINIPKCTTLGNYAFVQCSNLSEMSLSQCSIIGMYAFASCINLSMVSFPLCTAILTSVFNYCSALTNVTLPLCNEIGSFAFYSCIALSTISLPSCTKLYNAAFQRCANLLSVYLMGSSYVTLDNTNIFSYTPISNSTASTNGVNGSIYVPSSMLSTYKTMTNWATYASRFVGI